EMMRVRFIIGFYDAIHGIKTLPAPRRLGQPLWDTNTPFEVTEKVSAPRGLGIVEEFKLARELTGKRLKATVPGPYTLLVPLELEASQIVLEFANRGLDDAARWKDFPRDKELGAGVIDVKAFKAETPQEVATRIRALLRHVVPDKLWLNPDCGFWETPRWVVKQKLNALVEGARLVRKELT